MDNDIFPDKTKIKLRFGDEGNFKILVFSDIQEGPRYDPRTLLNINAMLDRIRPDLVILNGDNVIDCADIEEYSRTLKVFVSPMEERNIPWTHVYGNHDEECNPGMRKEDFQKIYESYPHSVSSSAKGIPGVGNHLLPIYDRKGDIAFVLYLLDSGAYIKESGIDSSLIEASRLPRSFVPNTDYAFIDTRQVMWYYDSSEKLERLCGRKIPAAMFFHICLHEFELIANNPNETKMTGEKNEGICPGMLNSGLFAAAVQRGDVKGIYCGHDHVNTYEGTYFGVRLGFCSNMGFSTYGLPGDDSERNRLRGARLITLCEKDPENFRSEILFCKDFQGEERA